MRVYISILYLMLVVALSANDKFSKATSYLAAGISMLYGFIDEVHQLFIDGRSFTVNDLVKDAIGVLVACWLVNAIYFNKYIKSR
ncbi:VanZ family protein [Halobacillus shinanisalinarum]|uniref:VanZ family protein n=1 Tax=Halobacillus shinanisalinarum TaxID=2932258 RepID=A0ABY4H3X9_9BACI|nr:VanZ family protein [Halobacillus shinanisalinarum]UOQ94911.1 VanZ family protein [Halobacillus shinanisalinarum]